MTVPTLTPADFHQPAVLLSGTVDYAMYQNFRSQLATAPAGSTACSSTNRA